MLCTIKISINWDTCAYLIKHEGENLKYIDKTVQIPSFSNLWGANKS